MSPGDLEGARGTSPSQVTRQHRAFSGGSCLCAGVTRTPYVRPVSSVLPSASDGVGPRVNFSEIRAHACVCRHVLGRTRHISWKVYAKSTVASEAPPER